MPRHRELNDRELGWNHIRRRIERDLDRQVADWREQRRITHPDESRLELDIQIADFRERELNRLLTAAQDEYDKQHPVGETIEA